MGGRGRRISRERGEYNTGDMTGKGTHIERSVSGKKDKRVGQEEWERDD